jgi:hypothetical protein
VTTADFYGDGHLDLAVTNQGDDTVSVLRGHRDGTFSPAVNYAVGPAPTGIIAADVNGDGHPDLVTANFGFCGGGGMSILVNNGDGTFGAPITYTSIPNAHAVYAGDFDQDGRLDLVAVSQSQNVAAVLRGNGDGTFGPPQTFSVGAGRWA